MNFRPTFITCCLAAIFFINFIQAQSSQVRFDHITAEDGLSEAVINSIFQDSRGFMWFGTNDGLNRYDGYNFSVFKPSPDDKNTISSNLIYAITEDAYQKIWIGTTGAGLNCFDPVTEKFMHYYHDANDPKSIASNQIVSLYTDSQGRIWIGTFGGINLLLPGNTPEESAEILRVDNEADQRPMILQEMIEDKSGNIWLGTRSGLYHCTPKDNAHNFDFRKVVFDSLHPRQAVQALNVDQNGRLIIATNHGTYHQNNHNHHLTFQKVSAVSSQQAIAVDNLGKVWIGTYKGLMRFEASERNKPIQLETTFVSDVTDPHSLNKNVIRFLYKDRKGIIWVGTNGGGINKFDPERKAFFHYGNNLKTNGNTYRAIRSILEDSAGNIWIGTEGGGIFLQSAAEDDNSYNSFEAFSSTANRVFAFEEIEENGQRYILAGSEDAPFLQKFKLPELNPVGIGVDFDQRSSIFTILQDSQKNIWIGTYNGGLWRWSPKADGSYDKQRFKIEDGLKSNIIRKIFEDSRGNIWIGTGDGLHIILKNNTESANINFQVLRNEKNDPNTLSSNYILDIHEDTNGQIWVGTYAGGLNKLEVLDGLDQIAIHRYSEKDGLPNNSVKSIEEDVEGNIWISSNHGLTKFNPKTETFQNYTIDDGLQAREFLEIASTQRSNGELLFGGVNGFNAFYPLNISDRTLPPEVVFTKLLVNNEAIHAKIEYDSRVILDKSISSTEQITLKYKQNDFSVEFAALHYAAPLENKYAYQLTGYHDDWIEVSAKKRYATFTSLPPGDYTLLVKASNNDNVWTETPARLNIKIQPPIWRSWYAYTLYLALFAFALWLFRRYTVISVHEKHQLTLEYMEREKLEELNQMKLRFFTNISHELRTPLTLIIAPLEHILEKGRSITPDKMQQQHHYMYKNAKYLLRLVNQLLDFRKLDQGSLSLSVSKGDIASFIQQTTEPFQFMANKKQIDFDFVNQRDSIDTYFDPDILEKVIYNLLSNAFKFTPTGGSVSVEIVEQEGKIKTIEGQYLEIRVNDTGHGIARNKQTKIFERFYKEGSKQENKDGAGIGLAYTKSLVELHHGQIIVVSKKGEGACFAVRLPMEKKAYLKSEIDQSQLEKFEFRSDPLEYLLADTFRQGKDAQLDSTLEARAEELPLLLFVDDNTDIRRFIKEGFQNDFRIIEAADGEQAYETAISSLPDIIVSDVMMPRKNGIELCKDLKTNALTSHIPVVLLTAKSAREDELEGLQTGADAYVVKPFKLDILRTQLLNIHLQRERLKKRFRQEVILEPEDVTVTSADEEFLKKAMAIIEEHMSDAEFNVEALVKAMYISRSKLYLKLKALTGQSTSEFMRTVRLKRAVQLLEKSDYTIKEIMYMTGFNTASYFSKCFKKQFGIVPSEYLKNKKKEQQMEEVAE